ncbi:potassium transporter peripheral membrane protein [Pelistega indica]|uniref:Trk system potassium uptake protein TrkA n=1 Tax=Pelistega indica TaxID=1414851 RepID=V8FVW7_9BURK|nr:MULTISPECIES: Trk system potassium transporter TrkA [Pelistega]ETD67863.1 potassium transporter peripheral membrane protein [Pelistega indica]
MKILLIGAGRVGSSVAENLVSEKNDITIVDTNKEQLRYLQERFDLKAVYGDASSPDVLMQAGAEDTDLLVSCAATDAVNLVTCKLAKDLFNIPRCISRIRGVYYAQHPEVLQEHFGVDSIISPEASVTQYLQGLIEFPDALQVVHFADGKVSIAIIKIGKRSTLLDYQIDKNHLNLPQGRGRILELVRNGESLPLDRLFNLKVDDELVLAMDTTEAVKAISKFNKEKKRTRSVMITGGGNIGSRLALALSIAGYNVRIIEQDKARCEQLAAKLPENVLVLYGNGTDESLLLSENIDGMDAWVAVTNDDEDNIMSSLLAKRLGAHKVIALISRQAYGELMQGSMIDVAVSPSQATIGALLHEVRQGAIVRGHRLRRGESEVIEFEVMGDEHNSAVVGKRVEDIRLPSSSRIAAILREEAIIIPQNDTVIATGDHVIVYAANRSTMKRIEKLFQVSAMFF